jgi:hypothetical protein
LAKAAKLGVSTVIDFEKERRQVSDAAVLAMRNALVREGVEFTNGKRPGVRLRTKPMTSGSTVDGRPKETKPKRAK